MMPAGLVVVVAATAALLGAAPARADEMPPLDFFATWKGSLPVGIGWPKAIKRPGQELIGADRPWIAFSQALQTAGEQRRC